MQKSLARKLALQKRNSLTEAQWLAMNKKLLIQFKKLDFSKITSLHIFLPIVSKKEPDTFLMIDWLREAHPEIEIIVPKANFETNIMSHYSYLNKQDLANNHHHIPEPQKAKPFVGIPDMVIVPLLAFDKIGYRVGYGKGFYDRFLENTNTQKVGLSFFDALEEIIDVHLNDIRLDKCITPTEIISFKS